MFKNFWKRFIKNGLESNHDERVDCLVDERLLQFNEKVSIGNIGLEEFMFIDTTPVENSPEWNDRLEEIASIQKQIGEKVQSNKHNDQVFLKLDLIL